jgi:fimbrial chaperone protein
MLMVGLACSEAACGATLQVLPLRVHLSADGAPEVVRVTNLAERPVLIQVETIAWADPDQLDEASRVSEVIAVPPIAEIQAQDEQLIRLALRKPSAQSTEQAYRLLITEVPRDTDLGENALALAIRLNLPLFVTPKGAKPDPAWSLRRSFKGSPELILGNSGNAHLRIRSLKLSPMVSPNRC